jgi:hypothetical protein
MFYGIQGIVIDVTQRRNDLILHNDNASYPNSLTMQQLLGTTELKPLLRDCILHLSLHGTSCLSQDETSSLSTHRRNIIYCSYQTFVTQHTQKKHNLLQLSKLCHSAHTEET